MFGRVMLLIRDPLTTRALRTILFKTSRIRLLHLVLFWVVLLSLFLFSMSMLGHTFDWINFALFVIYHVPILLLVMLVLITDRTMPLSLFWIFTLGLVLNLTLMLLLYQIVMPGLMLMLHSFSLLLITPHTPFLFAQFLILRPDCALRGR